MLDFGQGTIAAMRDRNHEAEKDMLEIQEKEEDSSELSSSPFSICKAQNTVDEQGDIEDLSSNEFSDMDEH